MVEEPEGDRVLSGGGDRVLSEREVWHAFDGKTRWHYNLPHSGIKYAVVAYSREKESNGQPRRTTRGAAKQGLRGAGSDHERE